MITGQAQRMPVDVVCMLVTAVPPTYRGTPSSPQRVLLSILSSSSSYIPSITGTFPMKPPHYYPFLFGYIYPTFLLTIFPNVWSWMCFKIWQYPVYICLQHIFHFHINIMPHLQIPIEILFFQKVISLRESKLSIVPPIITLHKVVSPLSVQSLNIVSNWFGMKSYKSYAHHLRNIISPSNLYFFMTVSHIFWVHFTHGFSIIFM